MAAFDYIALDAKGKERKGVIEADASRLARQQLRDKGLMPLEISESNKKAQGKNKEGKNSALKKPVFSAWHQYHRVIINNPAARYVDTGGFTIG